jgi:hypothetical protein
MQYKDEYFGEDIEDYLRRWDAGETIYSLRAFDLSCKVCPPGKHELDEACVQILSCETIRVLIDMKMSIEEITEATDELKTKIIDKIQDEMKKFDKVYSHINKDKTLMNLGISKGLIFFVKGSRAMLEELEGTEKEEFIMEVSKSNPTGKVFN